ncbi:hypothetical protein PG993_010237 [Apiospora rasikravindrae]|uniref:Uncharacterized protein n=1 Tax=Apiospora rasikravindrae TaxID=990691 RepID=A0ABR1SLZ8_9PEZI
MDKFSSDLLVNGKSQQPRVYLDSFIRILFRNTGAPTLWKGKEPPKTIVSRSLLTALLRCSVHVLPVGITIFLTWLNLTGYFIGDQLSGGAANHDRDFLLLQIAAKITEIAIVASLSTTVMYVIRAEAMSQHGIPLGLLSSPFRFSSINYFWSTAFLSNVTRSKLLLRRVSILLLVFACGVLAVVVGPSVALLMIPDTENAWPAGGTDFWLVGNEDTLWPNAIEASHRGGDFCIRPSEANITAAPMFQSSCPWNGYTQLAEGLKDRHFDWQSNVTFNDGVVKRQFTRHQAGADLRGGETWAFGPHVATASLLRVIADEWVLATKNASSAQEPGSNGNLKNATEGLGEAHVSSWLPTSRVRCWQEEYTNISSTKSFQDQHKSCSGRRYANERIATHWIDVPPATAQNHPSAAMVIEISDDKPGGRRDLHVYLCSIDTRWAAGTHIGSGLPETDNMVVYGALKTQSNSSSWAPVPGPDWRFAATDRAWLETLLPLMGGSDSSRDEKRSTHEQGWTTAAAMFAYAGFDNATGSIDGSFASLTHTIESTIATIVVDGMSRIGLDDNNGNLHHVIPDRYRWLRTLPLKESDPGRFFDMLLHGQTMVLHPLLGAGTGTGVNANMLTHLHWDVQVSGLAYSANSTAAYLALAVLLTCSAIAAGNIAYVLATRRSSEAWDCIEELVLLGQLSKPSTSETLVNTSSGIHRRAAYRVGVHILAREPSDDVDHDEEDIQLLLDPKDHEKLKPIRDGQAYGRA